jgi:hypothetical protein
LVTDEYNAAGAPPYSHFCEWLDTSHKFSEKLDSSESFNIATAQIAAALDAPKHSHTSFLPPPPPLLPLDYGWPYQMVATHRKSLEPTRA